MHTLAVAKTIGAPIEEVLEVFTDHEAVPQVPGVRTCRLTTTGTTERNGLGAVRELDCGAIRLHEEITGFDRPHRVRYRMRSSRPRADHELGQVDVTETPREPRSRGPRSSGSGHRLPAGFSTRSSAQRSAPPSGWCCATSSNE